MQEPLPPVPYFIFLSRAENRPVTEAWPVAFEQPLPTVTIPLLPGDADILLDLQATFTAVYDLLGYNLAIDYRQPPEIPLKGPAAQWADELLRSAGLRPS